MNAINRSDTMQLIGRGLIAGVLTMLFVAFPAVAQDSSIVVQCPKDDGTRLHPPGSDKIKCDHLVAGGLQSNRIAGNAIELHAPLKADAHVVI